MTIKPTVVKWSSLKRYFSERTEYANQARSLISEEIGFKPHIMASYYSEILLRNSLEVFDQGKITDTQLQKHIVAFSNNVRLKISRHIPEQTHLIDQEITKK